MANSKTLTMAALAGIMVLAGTGCDKLKARDNLNQGVASFKNAKYNVVEDVVDNLRSAGVDQLGLLTEQIPQERPRPAAPAAD